MIARLLLVSVIGLTGAAARAEATRLSVLAGGTGWLQVTIIALDANGMLATDYRGTVRITSDTLPALPVTHTFSDSDRGSYSFTTPGHADYLVYTAITATDVADGRITGTGVVDPMGLCEPGPPPLFLIVPKTACANSAGLTAAVPDGSVIAINWSIVNGTITSGQGTRSITFSAGETGVLTIMAQGQMLTCGYVASTASVPLTHCRRRSTR